MAYNVQKLVTNSFYLSTVRSRTFQTVSAADVADGVDMLNEILAFQSINKRLVPFYSRKDDLVLQIGVEKYFLENVIEIDTFTFNLDGDVRYPSQVVDRTKYFSNGRPNNVQALPFIWHQERVLNGTDLYVYFLPNQEYTTNLTVKYGLTQVTQFTDLLDYYEMGYIRYLRYKLAQAICQDYGVEFAQDSVKVLESLEHDLQWVSAPDLTLNVMNTMGGEYCFDWQTANLTNGWRP